MDLERIFLDLDGVLADWATPAIRACGGDPATVFSSWPVGTYDLAEALGISTSAMWRAVDMQGAKMWATLEPYPWCGDLFGICEDLAPTTILTSPSTDPSAASGKTRWLQSVFGTGFRRYLIGPDKAACARPGAILIDDSDANCEKFRASGGDAIVFPQIWNTAHTNRAMPLAYTRAVLSTFA